MISLLKVGFYSLLLPLLVLPNMPNSGTWQQINDENVIQNDQVLRPLFSKWSALANNQQQGSVSKLSKISIVHIGDSHLQTGVLTAVLRERLQMQFGNAGRGLLFPYKVARTNEPVTYVSSSGSAWEAKRCVFPENPIPIGISGITLHTTNPNADLQVMVRNAAKLDYSFDHITVFTDTNDRSFELKTSDEQLNYPDGAFKRIMYLNRPTNTLQLRCSPSNSQQQSANIYGISLEKAQSGILYHTIAVNGTQYQHLNNAAHFADQLPELEPMLVIISLGTNEALNRDFSAGDFTYQLDRMVNSIQQRCPGAAILLTSPANSLKARRPNNDMRSVAAVLRQYAQQHQLAFWDLNAIGGSEADWQNRNMLQSDGIHYTHSGYLFQGDLLHQALLKSYANYVSNR